MNKLMILTLVSLVVFFADMIYMISVFPVGESECTATELVAKIRLPIIIAAISALLFWASLISVAFLYLKKQFGKN